MFKSEDFYNFFYKNKALIKEYETFRDRNKDSSKNELFYNEIAKKYISQVENDLPYVHLDFTKKSIEKYSDVELNTLYKIFSDVHILGNSFGNDSNQLNKSFYNELLHIIGLEEVKEKGKKIIQRKNEKHKDDGSILENTISTIVDKDYLRNIKSIENDKNKAFNAGLELTLTWINRILFLKLLESQLRTYHNNTKEYHFLNSNFIKGFDDLNDLFFSALAKKPEERLPKYKERFKYIPYLNSSLFERTTLENEAFTISALNDEDIEIYSQTVLKDNNGKRLKGKLGTLDYLFRFLDAYDFATDGTEGIEEGAETKTLINASVLGLIFEKINGYKEGSFYTPAYITMYMSRETLRRAIVQKFKEQENDTIETFEDLKAYTHRFYKPDDLKRFNRIINSIKIVDPAVGSGHFLVSALNELISIKSELKILIDENGNPLRSEIIIDNDELYVTDEYGHLLDYKPDIKETAIIQKTLFHEKRTIIENCLFGVDINTNSVKICRLRLWIELLKNAYYTEEGKLQTLPNIDINIKTGNSLISRFDLNDDLKDAFKGKDVKYSFKDYKNAVAEYKNTNDKTRKNEILEIINEVKNNFKSTLDDKLFEKVRNAQAKYNEEKRRLEQLKLFDEKIKKAEKDNLKRLKEKAEKAVAEKEEILNNKIYRNAFEWRFEFPEVLNKNGNYVGFDVVIGNPPYGVRLSDREKKYLKKRFTATKGEVEIYTFFIELAIGNLLTKRGYFSYITTNTVYYLDKFSPIRKKSFLENTIVSLLELEKQVFADAPDIVPAIYIIKKGISNNNEIKLFKSQETKHVYDLVKFEGFNINSIQQIKLEKKTDHVFNLLTNEAKENLLSKLSKLEPIKNSFKVFYGIKTGDNKRFLTSIPNGNENWQRCVSSARNIKKYVVDWQGDYLNVCSDLAGLNNINYEQPKILIQYIRKLSMPTRLVCAFDINGYYYPLNNFSFIISENENSLKSLLGIMNSNLMNWYFSNSFVDYNIKPKYLERLPLPEFFNSTDLDELIDRLIAAKNENIEANTSKLEKEIDNIVYKLYGLTDEEIKIVEEGV